MEPKQPQPNYEAMTFPTDRLTFGAIRKRVPECFRSEKPEFFKELGHGARADVASVLWLERVVAHRAFNRELGLPDPLPDPDWSRREVFGLQNENYMEYGLSTGKQLTQQMLQDIEKQAAAQAKAIGGQNR